MRVRMTSAPAESSLVREQAKMISLEQWRILIGAWHSRGFASIRHRGSLKRKGTVNFLEILLRQLYGSLQSLKLWVRPSAPTILRLLVALSALLLVAGDVERNPGPLGDRLEKLSRNVDSSVLIEEDLFHVYQAVISVATKWGDIGLALGLLSSEIDSVEASYQLKPERCLRAVLQKWLQKTYNVTKYGPPTWQKLVEVVSNPAAGNCPALAEEIAARHSTASQQEMESSTIQVHQDPQQSRKLCREFAVIFMRIRKLLDESVEVHDLIDFLEGYSHPLYPEEQYVNPKVFMHASTADELLKSLFPKHINYIHYYLLEDIVEVFGCNESKKALKDYKHLISRKHKLDHMPAPISDEEIEQSVGTKRLKIEVDTNEGTVGLVESIQRSLEKVSGIRKTSIVYACQDPGSVILTFLIPDGASRVFLELNSEDLETLANAGVMKLQMGSFVLNSIKLYVSDQFKHKRDTKSSYLQQHLQQRRGELTPERYFHLLELLHALPIKELDTVCSKKFLASLAEDVTDWKRLALSLGLLQQEVEDILAQWQDEYSQMYSAFMTWKEKERDFATYHNLLGCILQHGSIEEVEVILQSLGPGSTVVCAELLLKHLYLTSNHDTIETQLHKLKFMQFNRELGKPLPCASTQLRYLDYGACNVAIDEFPSECTRVSVKQIINAIFSESMPILIKGVSGSGKSLLMTKICRYWAHDNGLRKFVLVFLVKLDSVEGIVESVYDLLERLLLHHLSQVEIRTIFRWVESREGENTLFILDGWTHEMDVTGKAGIFFSLLSRQCLKKSAIVITSEFTPLLMQVQEKRPDSTMGELVPSIASSCIQFDLLRLTFPQVAKQIVKKYGSNRTQEESVLLHLETCPDIKELISIPLYLFGFLLVADHLPLSDLPVTWTDMFTALTLLLLDPFFKKCDITCNLSQYINEFPHHLPEPLQTHLFGLCKVAFSELQENTIRHQALLNTCPELASPIASNTGVTLFKIASNPLMPVQNLKKFTFPLLQQFLAALYIHTLPVADQKSIMNSKHLWQFHIGMITSKLYSSYTALYEGYWSGDIIRLTGCSYEADLKTDLESIDVSDHFLSAGDIHHLLVCAQDQTEMHFSRCAIGTAGLVQLSKWSMYFHSGKAVAKEMSLKFSSCTLSLEGLKSLGALLSPKLRLEGLTPKQMCAFAVGLQRKWGVEGIDLRGTIVNVAAAAALAKGLCMNHSLRILILAWCRFDDTKTTIIAHSLREGKTLQELSLHGNAITDHGARELASALCHNQTLKILDLSANVIRFTAGALADCLCKNSSLQELRLSGNKLTDDETVYLAAALHQNQSLQLLKLDWNQISIAGARAIASALKHNSCLEELDLSGNNITDEGALALAEMLQLNCSLKKLKLEHADIRVRGTQALATSLCSNNSLKQLKIGNNSAQVTGAKALARALCQNQSLEELCIEHNRIHDGAASALSKALRFNKSLKMLDLSDNQLSDSGAMELADALYHNHSLGYLGLWKNDTTPDVNLALYFAGIITVPSRI